MLPGCQAACSSGWHLPEFQADPLESRFLIRLRRLGYIECMFEVLVYVYENYWEGEACPKLAAVGFEAGEIEEALVWLNGLNIAAQSTQVCARESASVAGSCQPPDNASLNESIRSQSAGSMRIYSVLEQEHLGAEVLGFVSFLESSGVLPSHMREIVVDRAMAAPGGPVTLDDLKIIVLMVYWSFGEEPDALVLDELCDDTESRVAH